MVPCSLLGKLRRLAGSWRGQIGNLPHRAPRLAVIRLLPPKTRTFTELPSSYFRNPLMPDPVALSSSLRGSSKASSLRPRGLNRACTSGLTHRF